MLTSAFSEWRLPWLAVILAATLSVLCGCQSFDGYHAPATPPIPSAMQPPTERAMVSLPPYRIEPPDLLQVEVLKMVPLPPYHLETFDVLQIQVIGTLLDQPIDGYYLIEAEGMIDLGAAYGKLRVVGLTIDEARAAVSQHLRQILAQPEVSVTLARTAGTQPVSGIYLVQPDGTINMRQYGMVNVAGRTLMEARLAIEKQLSQFFDSPEVSLDMAGFNSKVYYIITEGANLGDSVVRVPVTGNETVLDAISQIGGLSQLSSEKIYIARPGPPELGCQQILPVDWQAITRGGVTATNFQIMPGDRVFIAQDEIVAGTNMLAKMIAPIERLFGIVGLGSSTIRNTQTMGRSYNRTRSN
jgi:polysaccharide export outer membrane protein